MKKTRTKIYIHHTQTNNEFIYTGIDFSEFMSGLQSPPENLLLLKSECLGNNNRKNFEVAEGREFIQQLIYDDASHFGDFCFADYDNKHAVDRLTDMQISQMLFFAHMGRLMDRAFFDNLKNHFAYLSHDDGFFVKLYCRYPEDFINILATKISATILKLTGFQIRRPTSDITDRLLEISRSGLYMDLKDFSIEDRKLIWNVYTFGKITDMDTIYNHSEKLKSDTKVVHKLIYSEPNAYWELKQKE